MKNKKTTTIRWDTKDCYWWNGLRSKKTSTKVKMTKDEMLMLEIVKVFNDKKNKLNQTN